MGIFNEFVPFREVPSNKGNHRFKKFYIIILCYRYGSVGKVFSEASVRLCRRDTEENESCSEPSVLCFRGK